MENYLGRLYSGEKLPILKCDEYCVVLTDIYTGKVLNADKQFHISGDSSKPWVFIFNTLENARSFSLSQINATDKTVRCVIYSYNQQFIESIPP